MNDPISKNQWEARMSYYDRALRSLLELLEGTLSLVKDDGLTEVVVRLGKASQEIEDAWAALLREHASSMIAHKEHKEHGEPGSTEGHLA
jgi:hypothetical protein